MCVRKISAYVNNVNVSVLLSKLPNLPAEQVCGAAIVLTKVEHTRLCVYFFGGAT